MAVGATNSTGSTTSTSSTSSSSDKNKLGAAAGMGKDDFMQLLVAQLKNQDPMKPMEDKEFVAQLAQFSALEAMDKMTAQMEELSGAALLSQGASMIGKQVSAKLTDGTVVTGTVTQVRMVDQKPRLVVNGTEFDPSLITTIGS